MSCGSSVRQVPSLFCFLPQFSSAKSIQTAVLLNQGLHASWRSHLRSGQDRIGGKKKEKKKNTLSSLNKLIHTQQVDVVAPILSPVRTGVHQLESLPSLANIGRNQLLRKQGFSPCRAQQKRKTTLEVDPDCHSKQYGVGSTLVCDEFLSELCFAPHSCTCKARLISVCVFCTSVQCKHSLCHLPVPQEIKDYCCQIIR